MCPQLSQETAAQRERRLQTDRQYRACIRLGESSEEREIRLAHQQSQSQRILDNESAEARELRLEGRRSRRQCSLLEESSEAREVRLAAMRSHNEHSLREESAEAREVRLANQRIRRQNSIREESSEAREVRLAERRQRTSASARGCFWLKAGFNYDPAYDYANHPNMIIGNMDKVCRFCGAKKWAGEAPGLCCSGGKVRLQPLADPPDVLKNLFLGNSAHAKTFLKGIWRYNSCFAMTSFGIKNGPSRVHDRSTSGGGGDFENNSAVRHRGKQYTFKIQGQCYHRMGSLRPQPDQEPKFLQIYFMGGTEEEVAQRCRINSGVDAAIVAELQQMLHVSHPYVSEFKSALERLDARPELKLTIKADRRPAGEHPRRFNAPTTNEVAAILVGEEHGRRDIILQHRDNQPFFISETHRSYDCLQYPLLFPYGEDGYNFELRLIDPRTGVETAKSISCKQFYAYRLMVRDGQFNQVVRAKEITNQFLVDMYAKIEGERLLFIYKNQTKLRMEKYFKLTDRIPRDGNPNNVGLPIILPSSHTGSPRYMHQRTQDAMAYVRKFGGPDLFITFTCNSNWPEIKGHLFKGQAACDRHDLVARVFHAKLQKLMWLLKHGAIYGKLNAWMYTVEWQKRGLPHAHILIWCQEKIRPDEIDQIICAELPDPQVDLDLFKMVSTHMIHGPCGASNPNSPCMDKGKCTKRYPRAFVTATCTGVDGYPIYRRRAPEFGGVSAVTKRQGKSIEIDNSVVVPYSPFLVKTFNAHINVESCTSIKSIKYICKYVTKGGDMAVVGVRDEQTFNDEIKLYVMGRFISAGMAVWRILGLDIHQSYPPVVDLPVHLELHQNVIFREATASNVLANPPETKLTGFFKLCFADSFASSLLYVDIPSFFTWDTKKWQRRRQGLRVENGEGQVIFQGDAIGRVHTVSPKEQECFFFRMLLFHVKGPKSFTDVRTFDGTIYTTYREACLRWGLLEDDGLWNTALREAADCKMPEAMRRVFCLILLFCNVAEPLQLWESYKNDLSEDFLRGLQAEDPSAGFDFNDAIYNEALLDLESRLQNMGGVSVSSFGLPQPRNLPNALATEYMRELNYNTDEMAAHVATNEPLLLEEQRSVYNRILLSVNSGQGKLFFLDAPGGTGKTFLINILLAALRKEKRIALAVASSGIAATLLHGGQTAHSAFKLPLDLAKQEYPMCRVGRGTARGNLLAECSLIIWDEATMNHKFAFEALDRTLQDLRHNSRLMGGVTVLLAGDFRQTLPVIPRGTRADEVNASIKYSYLWPHIERLNLTTNMRVRIHGDENSALFSTQLLDVGNGTAVGETDGVIHLPFGNYVSIPDDLITTIFPDISVNFCDTNWLKGRAILAPHNVSVDAINKKLLDMLPGDEMTFKSIDKNENDDDAINYTMEFLNSQTPSGLPPHELHLKVGAPIMLLRNIEPPLMCNGTRMIVKKLSSKIIQATILNGPAAGKDVLIVSMKLSPSDTCYKFSRLQFPVKLSFAMTINKAQGQSLQVVGLNLAHQVFSHGQLYVGCSRVGSPLGLHIYSPDEKTKNVVYQEALQ